MFDTHCHLTYLENPDEAIKQAKGAGLTGLLSLSTNPDNFQTNLDLKRKYSDFVKIGIGIHPEDVSSQIKNDELELQNENAFTLFQNFVKSNLSEIDVIGECGLDYFHRVDNVEAQMEMFRFQLEVAKQYQKPVVVHSRNSKDSNFRSCIKDAVDIIKQFDIKAVCHCFTGNLEEAKLVLESGLYIGFTNIVTYPKNQELRNIVHFVIENFKDKILFETDAPFLPPAHRRGETCYPADVKYVYEMFEEKISKSEIERNVKDFLYSSLY